MKILCVTNLFPNRLNPNKGIYNWHHFLELQKLTELRVISPIPWNDEFLAGRRGQVPWAKTAWTKWEGVPVIYPRYYYTPGLWRGSYGSFLKKSIGRAFQKAVAEFQPDIVYGCFAYPDGWAACQLARECGLPVAVKVHGSDLLLLDEYPGRKQRTMEMLRKVDAISAVSNDLRRCAVELGTPQERAHLIYEGTDCKRFSPGDRQAARRALGINPDGLRLLFVGNLVPVKAVHILIDACARLLAGGLPFEADLVGEGPLRAELQQQITRQGLTECVRLRGRKPQSELPLWYRAADLVVLSSLSEGVPNVLVEAAACGTPFVATDVGGISEIAHFSPGGLVAPDDAAALARAIDVKLQNAAKSGANVYGAAIPTTADCAMATIDLFGRMLADRKNTSRTDDNLPQPALANS